MEAATIAAVFAAAGRATTWKRTNLGASTEVSHGPGWWTVTLPPEAGGHGESHPVKAWITDYTGPSGYVALGIEATWAETVAIVDAVLATRPR